MSDNHAETSGPAGSAGPGYPRGRTAYEAMVKENVVDGAGAGDRGWYPAWDSLEPWQQKRWAGTEQAVIDSHTRHLRRQADELRGAAAEILAIAKRLLDETPPELRPGIGLAALGEQAGIEAGQ